MSTKTKPVKKKKESSRSGLILIIGLIIILIPCLVFGGILLKSYLETSSPVLASRFEGDLDPAITDTEISDLKTSIEALGNVEKAEIVLTTAQFRVNVDTLDTLSKEEILSLSDSIYELINRKLPVNTYFTASETKKMYDLSLSVFNKPKNDDGTMIYYLITKNSHMDTASTQLVSEPVDEELAKELRGEGNDDTGEVSTNESDLTPNSEE